MIVFVTWFSSFWGQRKEVKRLKMEVSDFEEQLSIRINDGMAAERLLAEQELQIKQNRIDELEQQFSELSGDFLLEETLHIEE